MRPKLHWSWLFAAASLVSGCIQFDMGVGPIMATCMRVVALGGMVSITWRRVWGRRQAIRRREVSMLMVGGRSPEAGS